MMRQCSASMPGPWTMISWGIGASSRPMRVTPGKSGNTHVGASKTAKHGKYLKPGLTASDDELCFCVGFFVFTSYFFWFYKRKLDPTFLKRLNIVGTKLQHCMVMCLGCTWQYSHRRNITMLYQCNDYHFNVTHFVILCTAHKYQKSYLIILCYVYLCTCVYLCAHRHLLCTICANICTVSLKHWHK